MEFALVVPFLFLILFGIVDYGLWFNDSLNVRQGIRETARQGVVGAWGSSTECGTTDLDKLACTAESRIGSITGQTYVKVWAPDGWDQGDTLTVCAVVAVEGLIGLVPTPDYITSRVDMSVERIAAPVPPVIPRADALPSGASWDGWCT